MRIFFLENEIFAYCPYPGAHIFFTLCDRLGGGVDRVQAPGVLNILWGDITSFTRGADTQRLIPVHLVSLALRAMHRHLPAMETLRYMVRV